MLFDALFSYVAIFFDSVGLLFVIGSGLVMLKQSLPFPKKQKKKSKKKKKNEFDKAYHLHRSLFIHRIILGLDFFIVADLIKLAFASSYETLVQILLIVIIRTILSYFLLKETDL